MKLSAALKILAELRDDQIVVTTMAAAREWSRLSEHPLDLHHVPSAMGHAPGIGLGLAMVYSIIDDHGGYLDITSPADTVHNRGARFTIKLPRHIDSVL